MRPDPDDPGYLMSLTEMAMHYDASLSEAIGNLTVGKTNISVVVTLCGQLGGIAGQLCEDQEHLEKFLTTISTLLRSSAEFVLKRGVSDVTSQ